MVQKVVEKDFHRGRYGASYNTLPYRDGYRCGAVGPGWVWSLEQRRCWIFALLTVSVSTANINVLLLLPYLSIYRSWRTEGMVGHRGWRRGKSTTSEHTRNTSMNVGILGKFSRTSFNCFPWLRVSFSLTFQTVSVSRPRRKDLPAWVGVEWYSLGWAHKEWTIW